MYVRKMAILPNAEYGYPDVRFKFVLQYKRHFWQKWRYVLNPSGKIMIVSEEEADRAVKSLLYEEPITLNDNEQRN